MSAKTIVVPTVETSKKKRVSLEGVEGSVVDRKRYSTNGHWDFEDVMGGDEYVGFVYIIRNKHTGRCYIGKKTYRGSGKLNKGLPSNWPWYISSSKELSEDVKSNGKSSFEFICLEQYKSKGALSWAETWSICYVEAPCNQEKWYNRLIEKVSWVVKEKITERHKERLNIVKEML
jgi:hypothetical protein